MDEIYNWLLQNTGNEGNFYTILNAQRRTKTAGPDYFDIMARTKKFTVVNLFIHYLASTDQEAIEPGQLDGRTPTESYSFSNEQQVIDYLAGGKIPELPDNNKDSRIQILVLEPVDGSGDITFPPPNWIYCDLNRIELSELYKKRKG